MLNVQLPTRLSFLFPVFEVGRFNEKKKNNIHNFNSLLKCRHGICYNPNNPGLFKKIGSNVKKKG